LFIQTFGAPGNATQRDELGVPADAGAFDVDYAGSRTPDLIIADDVLRPGADGNWPRHHVAIPRHPADVEALRSAIIAARPDLVVLTGREFDASRNDGLGELRKLVYLGVFASFLLSGATAALSVAGSVLARALPFTLLRVVGCPPRALRAALVVEATLPLALVSVVSFGTAFFAGFLAVTTIGRGSPMPPPEFALPLAAGLALGLLLTVSALPLLGKVTATERVRFE
jgi:hypothetical protein